MLADFLCHSSALVASIRKRIWSLGLKSMSCVLSKSAWFHFWGECHCFSGLLQRKERRLGYFPWVPEQAQRMLVGAGSLDWEKHSSLESMTVAWIWLGVPHQHLVYRRL